MQKQIKHYLGLIFALVLTSGSLFAFNISTSIDNALQVIKTIWVTSDGTTNNPPFVTIDGSGGYVSIGTTGNHETLQVSGTFLAQDNNVSVSVLDGLYSGNIFYPLPTSSLLLIDPSATGLNNSTGIQAQVSVFDTRGVNPLNPQIGATVATFSPSAFNQNQRASISTHNANKVSLDVVDQNYHTSVDMESNNFSIYASGGYADMYFDGNLGLFGFGQHNPGNTIDIGSAYVYGTAGLRFSHWTNSSGQILGLNGSGDVVLLGNISGFGGGGTSYWSQNGNDLYPSTLTNNIGIGTSTPAQTLQISGTLLSTFTNQYTTLGLGLTPNLFGSNPSAGSYISSGGQFAFAGVMDESTKITAGMANFNNTSSQAIGVHEDKVEISWNSSSSILHRNGIFVENGGINSFIKDPIFGPATFTRSLYGSGELMRITNSGYVGIATANPTHTLTVSGSIYTNDNGVGFEAGHNLLGNSIPGAMNTIRSGGLLGFMLAGNPSASPLFDVGIGAYMGYLDTNGSNDNTIISASSGSIELNIKQGGNEVVEVDIEPTHFSIDSNNGWDNLWLDFTTNRMGINNTSPQKALDVSGAIVSSAMSINGPFDGVIDVQDVNSIFINPSSGNVDLRGLNNGTVGQIVYIVRNDNGGNNLTIHNQSNSNNADFWNPGSIDLSIGTNRGLQFIYNGWNWILIQ